MIKAVLCDLGNVLLDFSHARMCTQMGEVLGLPADEVQAVLFSGGWQKKIERGTASDEELLDAFVAAGGRRADVDAVNFAAADIFTPNEDSIAIIRELHASGMRLVLFSNTCASHINFIHKEYDVLDLFDELILSYEVGAPKPEQKFFEAGIAACDCNPDEIFYTDDIEDYITAAKSFGLQAERFVGAEEMRRQLAKRAVL